MTDAQSKRIALEAVRQRYDIGFEALSDHLEENWHNYCDLSTEDAVRCATQWLETNGFGPAAYTNKIVSKMVSGLIPNDLIGI